MSIGEVCRTEIDGVPAWWAEGPGNMVGQLVFRIGQADEGLHNRGTTHLIEHLALGSLGMPHLPHNGSVGTTTTSFVAVGSPKEVGTFLTSVTGALADLPTDRLANEIRVLETEASRREGSTLSLALSMRYGARGFGLPGFPELGLQGADGTALDLWRTLWFTRGNAVVLLTGPPPDGLDLSALPDGPRRNVERPEPLAIQPFPCWFRGPRDQVMVLLPFERSPLAGATIAIAATRLRQRLRHDEGRSYSVEAELDPLTNLDAHGVLAADCLADEAADTLDSFRVELTKLALHGPTGDELDEYRTGARRSLDDPNATVRLAERAAIDELLGRVGTDNSAAARRAELDGIAPIDVARALRTALDGAVWSAPGHVGLFDHRVHPITSSSPTRLTGTTLTRPDPVSTRHPDRLVVADEGVSLLWTGERVVTATWAKTAAVQRWPGGERTLWGEDGFTVEIRSEEWTNGAEAVAAVDRSVDEARVIAMSEPLRPLTLESRDAADDAAPARAARRAVSALTTRPSRLIDAALCAAVVFFGVLGVSAGFSTARGVEGAVLALLGAVFLVTTATSGMLFWRRRSLRGLDPTRVEPAPLAPPRGRAGSIDARDIAWVMCTFAVAVLVLAAFVVGTAGSLRPYGFAAAIAIAMIIARRAR